MHSLLICLILKRSKTKTMKISIIAFIALINLSTFAKSNCSPAPADYGWIFNNTCNIGVDTKNLTKKETKALFKRLKQKNYRPYNINIDDSEPWRALYMVPDKVITGDDKDRLCDMDVSIIRKGSKGYTTYEYSSSCRSKNFLWFKAKAKCKKSIKSALKDLSRCIVSPF
jgi:hypothetical protein